MKMMKISKLMITIIMVVLIASMACAAPLLKLNNQNLEPTETVDEEENQEVQADNTQEESLERINAGLTNLNQNQVSKKSNGASCEADNDCVSGYCKCVCKKSTVSQGANQNIADGNLEQEDEEVLNQEANQNIANDSLTQDDDETVMQPMLNIASLTGQVISSFSAFTGYLSLNLPQLEPAQDTEQNLSIEQETVEPIQEDAAIEEQEENVIADENNQAIQDQLNVPEEEPVAIGADNEASCDGVWECVCAPCTQDGDCGTGVCVNGVCEEETKKEINEACETDEDCKSGKCETKTIGGFFGIGGVTQKRCAEMNEEEIEEQKQVAIQAREKKIKENANIRTATLKALFKKLAPLEKKIKELENKAISQGLTTRAELRQECTGCYDLPAEKTQDALIEKKRKLKQRLSLLNEILADSNKIRAEKANEINNLLVVNQGAEIEEENEIKEQGGFMGIFGFATAIDNQNSFKASENKFFSGFFKWFLGNGIDSVTGRVQILGGGLQNAEVANTGTQDLNVPVGESECGDGECTGNEDLLECPSDCHECGDNVCTSMFENEDNCPEDCDYVCGNGICEGGEDKTCEDCRNDEYYINILTQTFSSLASIEERLCEASQVEHSVEGVQGMIPGNLCPDGTWQMELSQGTQVVEADLNQNQQEMEEVNLIRGILGE